MARNNGTYTPDNETMELLSRLEQGTIDKAGMEHLRMLFSTDPDFAAFFTSWRNAIAGKKQAQQAQQAGGNQRRATTGIDQYLNSKNSSSGYSSSSRTVSPGGFKASGRDSDSMARRSGRINSEEFIDANVNIERVKDKKGNDTDDIKSVSYGYGRKKRKYDDAKIQWILERGSSGATLGKEDQVVYDAIMQDAYRRNAEEKKRKAEQRELETLARANAEKARQRDLEEQRKREMAIFETNEAIRKEQALEEYKARAKREEQKRVNDAFNKRYGVDSGIELSDDEKKRIITGQSVWDYSPSDRKEVDKIQKEMSKLKRDDRYTDEEKARMLAQYQKQLEGFPKRLVDSKKPRTTDEMLAEAESNSRRAYTNSKGDLAFLPKTPEEERAESLEANKNKRDNDKFNAIGSYVTKEEEEWNKKQDQKAELDDKYVRQPFDMNAAIDRAIAKYDAINSRLNPAASEVAEAEDDSNLEEGYYEEVPWEEREQTPMVQQTPVAAPAPTPRQSNGNVSWRDKLGVEDSVAEPPEDNFYASAGLCPQCGAELDANGFCAACGYQAQM